MEKLLEMLKNGTLSNTLEVVGKVASIFNPALGGGLMLASNITDKIKDVPDDFLQNDVIGLNSCSEKINKMIDSKQVDFDTLEMISQNISSIAVFLQKSAKMVG